MKKALLVFLAFLFIIIIFSGISYGKTYAFIVGIDTHPYLKDGNLNYAVADAKLFRYVIQKEFYIPDDNIFMLTNEEATRENIRNTLTITIRNKLKPQDTLIIYYSGHGTRGEDLPPYDEPDHVDEYIVPSDARSELDENNEDVILSWSAIRDDDFSTWITSLPAKNIIIIFDSCYSGGAEKGIRTLFSKKDKSSGKDSFFQDLKRVPKLIVFLASSRANESSIESANIGHGYFTYSLYKALKQKEKIDTNKDNIISVGEIYKAVKKGVERATHHKQHPTLQLSEKNISPDKITFLALKKECFITIESIPSSSDVSIDDRSIRKTPIKKYKIEPGYHILKVNAPGYKEYKELIALSVGEEKNIKVKLKEIKQKEKPINLDIYLIENKGDPLSGYKIALTGTPYSKITDINGKASFKDIQINDPIVIVFGKEDKREIIYTQKLSLSPGENSQKIVINNGNMTISVTPIPLKDENYAFSTFSIEELNITIRYPKDWKVGENNLEKGILFKSESPESFLYEVFRIIPKDKETLDDFTKIQGEWLSKNYKDYKELKVDKKEEIGDIEGNVRLYSYKYKNNTYEVIEFYFRGEDGAFYIALFDVPKGKLGSTGALFEKLIKGIEFKETKENIVFKTYKTKEFIIKYPKTWKLKEKREDIVFESTGRHGEILQLLSHKLTKEMKLSDYAKNTEKWLKKHLKNYKKAKEKRYKNTIMREYTYTKRGIAKFVIEYYFVKEKGKTKQGFTLIFERPKNLKKTYCEKFQRIKEEIVKSFELL